MGPAALPERPLPAEHGQGPALLHQLLLGHWAGAPHGGAPRAAELLPDAHQGAAGGARGGHVDDLELELELLVELVVLILVFGQLVRRRQEEEKEVRSRAFAKAGFLYARPRRGAAARRAGKK